MFRAIVAENIICYYFIDCEKIFVLQERLFPDSLLLKILHIRCFFFKKCYYYNYGFFTCGGADSCVWTLIFLEAC